jgi:hypothetical protein
MVPPLQTLQQMRVPELKNLLTLEGLPVSGNKPELIARLQKYSGKPKPTKEWQHSSAKKTLKAELLDPTSAIHNMSAEEIWTWKPEFDQYPLFPKYLADMKKRVEVRCFAFLFCNESFTQLLM